MHNNYFMDRGFSYKNDSRFVPFAAPFLLGALTGGAAIATVNRPRPMYYYPPRPYYYPYY